MVTTIEDLTLKENYLIALNFPDAGLVSFKVTAREQILLAPYQINYSSTQACFGGDEWKDHAKIPHPTDTSIDNILEVDRKLHLYQLFYGIRPGCARSYLAYPTGKNRRSLDKKEIVSKSSFGYVDGKMSPYDDPQPISEIWLPRDIDIGFAWYNPTGDNITINVSWLINRYKVELINSPDTVEKILNRTLTCRIATLGGIDSFSYSPMNVWGVSPVPLDATRAEIEKALKKST